MFDIIEYRTTFENTTVDALEEAINNQNLIFNARSLADMGFATHAEISAAVERAIRVCSHNGLPIKEHFKPIYIADYNSHTVSRDWKLSKLAYTLVMINGTCDNPMVGRLQLEILNKYLKGFQQLEK